MTNNKRVTDSDAGQEGRSVEQDRLLCERTRGRGRPAHQDARGGLAGILCPAMDDRMAPAHGPVATAALLVEMLPAKLFEADADLFLCGTRCYDPTPGRWFQEDPIGFEAGETHLHPYLGDVPTEPGQ